MDADYEIASYSELDPDSCDNLAEEISLEIVCENKNQSQDFKFIRDVPAIHNSCEKARSNDTSNNITNNDELRPNEIESNREQFEICGIDDKPLIDMIDQLSVSVDNVEFHQINHSVKAIRTHNENYVALCESDIPTCIDYLLMHSWHQYSDEYTKLPIDPMVSVSNDYLDDHANLPTNEMSSTSESMLLKAYSNENSELTTNQMTLTYENMLLKDHLSDGIATTSNGKNSQTLQKSESVPNENLLNSPKEISGKDKPYSVLLNEHSNNTEKLPHLLSTNVFTKPKNNFHYTRCKCGELLLTANSDANSRVKVSEECQEICDCDLNYFEILPYELINKIFAYLTPQELCQFVAPVCSSWLEHSRDPVLWTRLSVSESVVVDSFYFKSVLSRARHLKHLSLTGRSSISASDIITFAIKCPNISSLDLGFCSYIPDYVILLSLSRLKSLQHLNLEGNEVTDTLLKNIPGVISSQCLHEINLSYCTSITDDGIIVLSHSLPKITYLNIDGIQWITDSAIKVVVDNHRASLVSLFLDGENLTDSSMKVVSTCENLRRLSLWYCDQLTNVSLSHVKNLSGLTDLTLRKGEQFTTRALIDMLKFYSFSLPQLRSINLNECKCMTDHVIHLICLNLGHQLQKLSVAWCWDLTEKSAEYIVDHCRFLKCLNMTGIWHTTGTCFRDIPHKMPYLEHLTLENCKNIDDDLMIKVAETMPSLKVIDYYGCVINTSSSSSST